MFHRLPSAVDPLSLRRRFLVSQLARCKARRKASQLSPLGRSSDDNNVAEAIKTQCSLNNETADLVIIGAHGAIGLPASYLATLRGLKVVMVDSGGAALDGSTHTVHTSITRPNNAVWPVGKAVSSWLQNGPFDVNISPKFLPFAFHSVLQTYFVSDDRLFKMWKAFRRLGLESREIYKRFDRELGCITIGGTGRAHLPSPLVNDDKESVLDLREKLCALGVESEIITDRKDVQDYVGRLQVRHPDLMVRYPEDFVLDLQKYKAGTLRKISSSGGVFIGDTVTSLERDSSGNITAVLTQHGNRIQCRSVLYTGGWKAGFFIKKCLGINLDYHLTVASGVRFVLPDHLVDRSIVGGPMFLAPGYDASGLPVTDVGQMFLTNFTSPFPSRKHLAQALRRFHTYFAYQAPITKIWTCVGRPITTSGMPFIERVAPNMVVALGPGMFGVTVGAGLAKRGLDLVLEDISHPDHLYFQRQSCWDIVSHYFQDKVASNKSPPKNDAEDVPRVIQLGKRGAITTVFRQSLPEAFDYAVYPAREINSVIKDIGQNQGVVLLVASHGPQAKLPAHYGEGYLTADEAIKIVLAQSRTLNLRGIIVISGGIPKSVLHDLASFASKQNVRFVHLPGLATSMEVLINVVRALLPFVDPTGTIAIEDTFHAGKKERPSAGGYQLLGILAKVFGEERLLITVDGPVEQTELRAHYPAARVESAQNDERVQSLRRQHPDLIHIISRSNRIDGTSYCYQHRVILPTSTATISIEQSVTDRVRLVPPIKKVIQQLGSFKPSFVGTGISSVLPVTRFRTNPSLLATLAGIIENLQKAGALVSLRTRDAQPDQLVQSLLRDTIGQTRRFQHTPSLPGCIQVEAEIDSQPLSITVSSAPVRPSTSLV